MDRDFSTPMMKQYMAIKKQYSDCVLFFRLGDFYELFLEDAIIGSKILDLVLTRRPRGKDGDIPMAGMPYHASDAYIAKMVKAGYKVAICEQVSDPSAKGIVERDVIRIVTPGSILDEKSLTSKEHNYTVCISLKKSKDECPKIGFAFLDVSTGDFEVSEFDYSDTPENSPQQIIANELSRFLPSECILEEKLYTQPELLKYISEARKINIFPYSEGPKTMSEATKLLQKHFKVKTLRGFGIHEKESGTQAAATLLSYVAHTQKNHISHINAIRCTSDDEHVKLDASTIANLELFKTIRESDERATFIDCLDETKTAAGGRMLRQWIREPLHNRKEIEKRLEAVEVLLHEHSVREKARIALSDMHDIERILSRLSVGIGTPPDIINLKNSLLAALKAETILSRLSDESVLLEKILSTIPEATIIRKYIEDHIEDIPPFDPKSGGLIRSHVDTYLDTLRENIRESKQWIANLEHLERKRTGINSLKVKFNSIFGYYIEITRANLDSVPTNYIRKQTTINAERFITKELQEYEEEVLRGEELICAREYELFTECIYFILSHTKRIQTIAECTAILDCLHSFAYKAEHERYVKPSIINSGEIIIEDGRHPVVEELHRGIFVPNNTRLGKESDQLLIITGPNMAGKSVYMRQVALITLMAHMGSFVPARKAEISLVDHIFVRSGASDSIGSGLSTFMVEMIESAYILHHATADSLIIMDEIGRGTSTYDGISIASAIAEFLVSNRKQAAKTLFATHYHELQALEKKYPQHIKNVHMAIEESSGSPIFLYRLAPGGATASFAIAVAKLAGIPEEVTKRATEVLSTFEHKKEMS